MQVRPYWLVEEYEQALLNPVRIQRHVLVSLATAPSYHLHPLWVDQTSNCPTTPAWWAKVLSWDATGYCAGDAVGITPLLLHLPTHCAGAAVLGKPGLPVVVFDPTQPEQLRFETLADFSTSTYGQCIMVSEVSILRGLDFFPAAFAPRLPHVRPEVRETTQGMRLS